MRKLRVLLCLLSAALLLTACAPKDMGEEGTKKAGLAFVNRVFDVNETEATLLTDYEDGYYYENGARIVAEATSGDGSMPRRVVCIITVGEVESNPRYQALVNGSTGAPYYAWQSEQNIVMTAEQTQKANALYAGEKTWGEKHADAFAELKDACIHWVEENLMDDYPVLLASEDGAYDKGPITTRLKNRYYVVMLDGSIYQIEMQWPSMQVLSLSVINEG